MSNITFTVDIAAPKQKVWDIMLSDETYRQWTDAFHEESYYEGNWEKGSRIRFLAPDDGKLSGMSSKVVENIPYEFVSLEHIGEIIDGQEDTTSEMAKQWAGAHENYRFREESGVTTLTVELSGDNVKDDMSEMFEDMWPPALQKLKEICER